MELKGLRFPFPLTWRAERGHHALTRRAGIGHAVLNCPVRVRVEELFDARAIPDETGAATGWLELDIDLRGAVCGPDWHELAVALRRGNGSFGLALTQGMFKAPSYAWTIEEVARELGVTRRELQMTLFRESYSFDAALKRCRSLNGLLRQSDTRCRFVPLV